jgi:hypothetical protein
MATNITTPTNSDSTRRRGIFCVVRPNSAMWVLR